MLLVDAWDVDGWANLVHDVGTWAELNFGHSEVPLLTLMYDDGEDVIPQNVLDLNAMVPSRAEGRYTGPTAALGPIAPILGLVEEIGEFSRATTREDTLDAIGDIMIYMADAMNRLRFTPAEIMSFLGMAEAKVWPGWLTVNSRLCQAVGQVAHVTLKRAQRIRDMHDATKYRFALVEAFADLASAVEHAAALHTKDDDGKNARVAWLVGREVFDAIVVKRNWRK